MLKKKRTQNQIAESRFTLPIAATLIALIWVAVGLLVSNIWAQFAFTIISTFLMVELNNRNALMRTYSRMVSCSFLVLITMAGLPTLTLKGCIVTMCYIAFYLIAWNTYQDKRSVGWTFYAYLCIGLASTIFIQILYLLPFLWLLMIAFTNSLSVKNICASILGLITPYWFSAGFYIFKGNFQSFIAHFNELMDLTSLFDYSQLTDHLVISYSFIFIIAIIGIIHFLRSSYADKIRTRMIYESLIVMDLVSIALMVLLPNHAYEWGGICIVNTAPLVAHFITFTHTKLTNITFVTMSIIAILITLYNIAIPPMLFINMI